MKINTTWTQENWNDALKKAWSLATNFEEILNFGLENGFITSSDIIHASDIYKDPNKEYEDDEIKEIISSRGLRDIMSIIKDEYPLDEILDELPTNDILDNMDDDDLLDHLDGSWVLESHDDDIKEQVYHEYVDEWIEEMKAQDKDYLNNLYNANADDFHEFICDVLGCGYYDTSVFDKLKEKLKNNSYISYDK